MPPLLSAQLSAIIIALVLSAKTATEDYGEGEMKGQNDNCGSGEERREAVCGCVNVRPLSRGATRGSHC